MTDGSTYEVDADSGTAQISAAHSGDADAMGDALEACRLYLKQIAREELSSKLQAKEDASDVVQATLLKAQLNFHNFEGNDRKTLRFWLRKILINTLKDIARKYEKSEKRQVEREVRLEGSSQINPADKLPGDDPTPSEVVMAGEREEALVNALSCLTQDQRRVIQLRTRKHLDFEEIGEILGRSAEAVRLLWYRAVQRLADELRQSR